MERVTAHHLEHIADDAGRKPASQPRASPVGDAYHQHDSRQAQHNAHAGRFDQHVQAARHDQRLGGPYHGDERDERTHHENASPVGAKVIDDALQELALTVLAVVCFSVQTKVHAH